MEHIEDYEHFDLEAEENETEEEVLHRFCREEFGPKSWSNFTRSLNPRRLLYVLFCMVVFQLQYYITNCEKQSDGSWTSKPIFMPERVSSWLAYVFPLKVLGWHQASEP